MTKTKVAYDLNAGGKRIGTYTTLREAKEAAAPYAKCEIWQYDPDTSESVDVGTRVYAKLGI